MSFRLGAVEGDEELFDTVSGGGDSDADEGDQDHFPDGGAGGRGHRAFVPQPLRRMNSDSIYDMTSMMSQLPPK